MINAWINGKKVRAMVDTGANVSLISAAFAERSLQGLKTRKNEPYMLKVADHGFKGVNDEIQMVRIEHQDRRCIMDIDVVDNLNGECILGLDWLDQTGFLIDPLKRQLMSRSILNEQNWKQCAHTVWVRPDPRPTMKQVNRMTRSDQDWKQEMMNNMEEYSAIPEEYKDYIDVFANIKTIDTLPKHQL